MGCGCRGGNRSVSSIRGSNFTIRPRITQPNIPPPAPLPIVENDVNFGSLSFERRRIEKLRRDAIRRSLGQG